MGILDERDDDEAKRTADFSNVRSGSSSTAPDAEVEQSPVTESTKSYTVVAGDSLSKIARVWQRQRVETDLRGQQAHHQEPGPDLPGQELAIPNSLDEV